MPSTRLRPGRMLSPSQCKMNKRVAVTGIGVVSPVGNDKDTFFANLFNGVSGISHLASDFADRLTIRIAGQVHIDPAQYLPPTQIGSLDRVSHFALIAACQALTDSGVDLQNVSTDRIGVYFGTGAGGIGTVEDGYVQLYKLAATRARPLTVVMGMHNAPAAQVGIRFGLRGPNITYSTACASSTIAIGEAYRAIKAGHLLGAVAGGAEALLTLGMLRAWEALCTLAPEDPQDPSASCRPFSKDRHGLVLAEGAAVVFLEDAEVARERGAQIYAELLGYGANNDAAHLTKPLAESQAKAMILALEDAGVDPRDIDYINAHGTATSVGDVAETDAIKMAFGRHAYDVPISSTKALHGHLMGATGAVEFIASVLSIRNNAIPPTAHLRVPDPACDLDYVPNTGRGNANVRVIMSNSFAFGGSNAVLVAGTL